MSYCYDSADRLVSASDVASVAHDERDNVRTLGSTYLSYDGSDRHLRTTEASSTVRYERDVTGRLVGRETSTAATIVLAGSTSASNGAGGASLALSVPGPTAAGEVLVAQVALAGGTATAVTTPPGWTRQAVNTNSTYARQYVFFRVATGTEPASYTFSLTNSQQAAGGMARYSGVDPASPMVASTYGTNTAATVHTAPGVTIDTTNTRSVSLFAVSAGAGVATGLSQRWQATSTGATAGRITAAMGDVSRIPAYAIPDRTATSTIAAASVSHHLILRPKRSITTYQRYGYTASGDSPNLVLDSTNTVIERTVGLPGGVIMTKRAAGDVWSYPNIHSDITTTADNTGTKQGPTITYDPDGNPLTATPDNSAANLDYAWLGQHQRPTETQHTTKLTELGARTYTPNLARFLQTDPIEGGSANDYDYVNGDPVNGFDLTGTRLCFHIPFRHDNCDTRRNPLRRAVRFAARETTEVVATAPYGVYQAGMIFNRELGHHFAPLHFVGLQVQRVGIHGDMLLDHVKRWFGAYEPNGHEERPGCILPLHSLTGICGYTAYLNGASSHGHIHYE